MRAADTASWKKLPIKRRLAVEDNMAANARLGRRERVDVWRLVFGTHSSSYMYTKQASLEVYAG